MKKFRINTRKGVSWMMCAALLSLMLSNIADATDQPTAAYYETRQITEGVMISGVKSNVRKGPGTEYSLITRMDTNETCTVLGEENGWYKIEFDGYEGYILKDFLEVRTYETEVAVIVEEPLDAEISALVTPRLMERKETFSLQGVLQSNIPMTGVTVSVTNLRTMAEEMTGSVSFVHDDNVCEYDLLGMDNKLQFRKLSAGEKRLSIIVSSANDRQTVLEEDFYVIDECGELTSMTKECDFHASSGNAGRATDGHFNTAWTPEKAGDTLTIDLPEGRVGQTLTLDWSQVPDAYTVEMKDHSGAILRSVQEDATDNMLSFCYNIQGASQVVVRVGGASAGVSEACVYEQGKTSELIQDWEPLSDHVDMMVFAAHAGDEFLFFGGAVPFAAAEGKEVAVVYMADCGRQRMAEAMDGLWSVGVKAHPYCLYLENGEPDAYEDAIDMWGLEELYELLVEQIRKYKPSVVLTHDIEGEDGDNQHKLTSAAVRRAVLLAADPGVYPESYDKYGVWDVPKTYIHKYEGNVLEIDSERIMPNGWTAQEMLQIGLSKNVILWKRYDMDDVEKQSPYSFGLIRQTVGEDVEKNSFFENLN